MTRKPGFAAVDAVVAVALLGAAAFTMASAKNGASKLDRVLADRRAAVRLAESVLDDPHAPPPPGVSVHDLPTAAPAGWTWVRVEAVVHGGHGELVGLVRSVP